MKKALTILAILIIAAGTLFAAAPASSNGIIKLKSTVDEQDPAFRIKAIYNQQTVTGDADGNDLTVNDISEGNITVVFGIYQTEDAKTSRSFHFTVTFGQFQNDNYVVDKPVTVKAISGDWYTVNAADGIKDAEIPDYSATSNKVSGSVSFSGMKAVLKDAKSKRTFNVTWEGDNEAPAGDYVANVEMSISVD